MVVEHIIAGYSIPHNEGAIPLTKESYDINNPQKRSSDYSKTITIPEDNVTNQIFEHAFDVNVLFQTFNPSKKTSYQVVRDGIVLIDGYCQLREINNVEGKIVYKIQAVGKTGDIFEKINNLYLTDLDFSTYNHVWSVANVENSWTPTLGEGYVYPMIDLGGRTNYTTWKVSDFKPAFFVREYITKIFSAQGFTIASSFFDTTLFKSLIIPYVTDNIPIDNAAIKDKTYSLGLNAPFAITGTTEEIIFDDSSSPYYNTSATAYNVANGVFTVNESNSYSMQCLLDFNLDYAQTAANNTSIYEAIRTSTGFVATLEYSLIEISTGTDIYVDSGLIDITQGVESTAITAATSITGLSSAIATNTFYASVGEEYVLLVNNVTYKTPYLDANYGDWTITLQVGSNVQLNIEDTNYQVGDTLVAGSVIPKDVKQIDFVGSIIKRFNLYLSYDDIDPSIVYIEPREDYLLDTSEDLSEMVDRSKDVDIKPLGALDASTYLFTDIEDSDKHNTIYNNTYNEVYGQRKIEIDNDFVKNEKAITSIFSPTPLESIDNDNDRVISSVRFEDENGNKVRTVGKIRLLYWGGLLPTAKSWTLGYLNFKTSYPYAGHLDNPYAPTFDLNWGVPKELYYNFNYGGSNVVTYPNSNVYSIFWANYIQEITDKNSKVLECSLALRPNDYSRLSFRNNYYIDGSYWRLLKVIDYDVNANETTKCIFLKAEPQTIIANQTIEIMGGEGAYNNGEDLPTFGRVVRPNDGFGRPQDSLIYGDNVSSGRRSVIVSSGVISGSGTEYNAVFGSNNSKLLGSNITLINSPNTNATRSGETYINGLFAEKLLSVIIPYDVLINLNAGLVLLPTLEADEFYQITRGYVRLNGGSATSGVKVLLSSTTSANDAASIPAAFFNTSNNTGLVTMEADLSDFGESLTLSNVTNMEFLSGSTTLTLNIVYRIIKL